MNAFKTCGRACLNQAGRQRAQRQSDIPHPTSTAKLVSSIPGACQSSVLVPIDALAADWRWTYPTCNVLPESKQPAQTSSDSHLILRNERTYLKPPNQKPIGRHLRKRLSPELQQRRDPPANVHSRHQPVHRDVRENEQEWDLPDRRANDVHCLQLRQFVPVETEVFFHSRDVRIVYAKGQ